jgi:hypothetical protein
VQILTLITDLAQILSPLLYSAFIVVIWFQFRAARESVQEVRAEFLAGGRPVVTVHDHYDPEHRSIELVVENVGGGPAKNIAFEFSRPIESSDGTVLSDLPVFTHGPTSLAPGASITCFWDDFDDLMEHLRRHGLEGIDFVVTARYADLTGSSYADHWDIQPAIYRGLRHPAPEPQPRITASRDGHVAAGSETRQG